MTNKEPPGEFNETSDFSAPIAPKIDNTKLVGVVAADAPEQPIAAKNAQDTVDKNLEIKKTKQTDKLITAIIELSKITKDKAKKDEKDKKDTPKTIKEFTKLVFKDKLSTIKSTAKETLLSKVGLGKGQLIGSWLNDRKEQNAKELQNKVDFKTNFAKNTEEGKKLSSAVENETDPEKKKIAEERLVKESLGQQEIREKRIEKLEVLKKEKSAAEDLGMKYSGEKELKKLQETHDTQFLSEEDKKEYLVKREKQLKKDKPNGKKDKPNGKKDREAWADIVPKETSNIKPKQVEDPFTVKEPLLDEYDAMEEKAKKRGDVNELIVIRKGREQAKAKAKLIATTKNGIDETANEFSPVEPVKQINLSDGEQLTNQQENNTLLDIQEKQLKALNTLVENSTVSEEDKLEANKPETNTVEKENKKTDKDKKEPGIFDSLLDMLAPLKNLGGTLSSLMPAISSITSIAGPILAVGAAATAGVAAGNWLNKNTNIQKNIASGIDAVKGAFGNSDDDKQKAANIKAVQDNYDKRVSEGNLTPKSAEYFERAGIKVDKSKITTIAPSPVNALIEAPVNAPAIAPVEAPIVASRVSATDDLKQTIAESEQLKQKTETPNKDVPVIINNTNNSKTIEAKVTPPIRNVDLTFNKRLEACFS